MSEAHAERVAIIDDPRFEAHCERNGQHPERPERLQAARSGVYGALNKAQRIMLAPERATDAELCAVHPARHVHALQAALSSGYGSIDGDTYFSPGTAEAAWLAAGGAAQLARALLAGDARRGVLLARPPGHHAEPDRAMGFCLLNNVAIAAHAALTHGAAKVAIVDFDVHHGNGTQNAFYADPRVLFISLHQHPLYPGTGRPHEIGDGLGRGYTVNLALPQGQGPEAYGLAFRRVVLPVLSQFAPDLVLVSAGFDAHTRDPLAGMELDADCYRAMTSALVVQAEAAGHGRVALILEGGYDLIALEQSLAGATLALQGQALALPEERVSNAARTSIEATRRALAPYWTLPDSEA